MFCVLVCFSDGKLVVQFLVGGMLGNTWGHSYLCVWGGGYNEQLLQNWPLNLWAENKLRGQVIWSVLPENGFSSKVID